MRNEDLFKRLSQMSFEEVVQEVEAWIAKRTAYAENLAAMPKRKKGGAAKKSSVDKTKTLIDKLTPEQKAALLEELENA